MVVAAEPPSPERNCDMEQELSSHAHVHRVLVVGAGVAGVQAVRRLKAANFNVFCIEKAATAGGVWSKNFSGFKAQVPWEHYQFPDFPYPKHLQAHGKYPSGPHIQQYIHDYVHHFNLAPHIHLNCSLVQLKQHPTTHTWLAVYYNSVLDSYYKVWVEFVVIATGIYNQPYVPKCHGATAFKGLQLHSRDFHNPEALHNKRVLIVGAGKTALDCIAEVATKSKAYSVTMLYRQSHWPVPRKVKGMTIRRFIHSRTMTRFLPPYYTEVSPWKHALHRQLQPLKSLLWTTLEHKAIKQFDLKGDRVPDVPLRDDMQYTGIVLDNTFDQMIKETGNVHMINGELNIISEHGVILKDGSYREAEVILYCTGYNKSYDFLSEEIQHDLELQKDGLYLYRSIIAPRVTNLAFIGCEASTYNNILTSGLQALWLTHLLTGHVKLPDSPTMQADVAKQRHWKREIMPQQRTRGSSIMLYQQAYHDQLMKDMKLKCKRKGFIGELIPFNPYTAMDYTQAFRDTEEKLRALHPDNRGLAPELPEDFQTHKSALFLAKGDVSACGQDTKGDGVPSGTSNSSSAGGDRLTIELTGSGSKGRRAWGGEAGPGGGGVSPVKESPISTTSSDRICAAALK